jgi:hypothetical protein
MLHSDLLSAAWGEQLAILVVIAHEKLTHVKVGWLIERALRDWTELELEQKKRQQPQQLEEDATNAIIATTAIIVVEEQELVAAIHQLELKGDVN